MRVYRVSGEKSWLFVHWIIPRKASTELKEYTGSQFNYQRFELNKKNLKYDPYVFSIIFALPLDPIKAQNIAPPVS